MNKQEKKEKYFRERFYQKFGSYQNYLNLGSPKNPGYLWFKKPKKKKKKQNQPRTTKKKIRMSAGQRRRIFLEFNPDVTAKPRKTERRIYDVKKCGIVKKVFPWKDYQYEISDKCPACEEGKLRLRNGRFGEFLGCSTWPDCKYTTNNFVH
jgi:hypothetical protein